MKEYGIQIKVDACGAAERVIGEYCDASPFVSPKFDKSVDQLANFVIKRVSEITNTSVDRKQDLRFLIKCDGKVYVLERLRANKHPALKKKLADKGHVKFSVINRILTYTPPTPVETKPQPKQEDTPSKTITFDISDFNSMQIARLNRAHEIVTNTPNQKI